MQSHFFFQAEDGIRDSVASRGLGDVYKRQGVVSRFKGLGEMPPSQLKETTMSSKTRKLLKITIPKRDIEEADQRRLVDELVNILTVSYTHLTLPTILLV